MSRKSAISPYLIAALLIAWALLTIKIGDAWFGHQDANGAWISVAVRNYQLHGFFQQDGLVNISTGFDSPMEPYTHHPPLIVWLETPLVLLFGYDEALIRFVAASCTLIGAAALYVLARRLKGRIFAFWSTAFYVFTPMIAYFGRMPDHEAPALMFSLLFAAVLIDWLRRPTRRKWWALVVLTVLVAWTAWGGLIMIGILTLAALFFTRRRVALIMLGVVAFGAVIAVLGYFEVFSHDAIPDLINAFVWRTSTSSLEPGAINFTAGEYVLRIVVRLVTLYTPSICVLMLIGAALVLRQRGLLRTMLLAFVAAGVGYALLFRNASYIHDYYLLYLAPALGLLAGGAVVLLPKRSRWLRPLVASLVLVTLPATLYYLNDIYRSSDATLPLSFAQVVHDQTAPDDLIISNLPNIGDALEFYAERTIAWGEPYSDALEAATLFKGATYYLHCDSYANLPDNVVRLAEVEISPQCYLTRLR